MILQESNFYRIKFLNISILPSKLLQHDKICWGVSLPVSKQTKSNFFLINSENPWTMETMVNLQPEHTLLFAQLYTVR